MKWAIVMLVIAVGLHLFVSKQQNQEPIRQVIEYYEQPVITERDAYTVIMVGDSMTDALGPNFDELRKVLKVYYPDKAFGLFNYGFGSSNILSVEKRLKENSNYLGANYPAILEREFEIIMIESFGYNPLSELPLEEGIKKQTEELDKLVFELVSSHPGSLVVFVATIAPSRQHYGEKTVDLSAEVRKQWAQERISYIENHISYALSHNIPLVNVYQKSLTPEGEADLKYINSDDYIHPSTEGVKLISQEIGDFLRSRLP